MTTNESSISCIDSFIAEVRDEWRSMWKERIDDHVRAEGIAERDYDKLFLERGTVVLATRNFKLLTLKDILERHRLVNAELFAPSAPYTMGWRKFGRAHAYKLLKDEPKKTVRDIQRQLKKGGRGWLHK